jgi:hypothetical protein
LACEDIHLFEFSGSHWPHTPIKDEEENEEDKV